MISILVPMSTFAAPVSGTIMVSKGQVKIKSGASTTDAKVGSKIQEGDMIVTGPDSRAKIVMADRNVINVNPDTELVIEIYQNDAASGQKNVQMNLLNGKVRSNVEQTYDGAKSKFLIKTPTAVAGVRGTQFLAGFFRSTGMTSIVTFKGAVQLFAITPTGQMIGAPVEIRKGQTSSVQTNSIPEPPKDIPKQEIKKMDVDTTASMKGPNNSNPEQRNVASEAGPAMPGGPNGAPGMNPPPPPPVSMVTMQDMDMSMAKQIKEVREVMMPSPPPNMIKPPSLDSSIVKDIIRDTASKTRVIVQPQIN